MTGKAIKHSCYPMSSQDSKPTMLKGRHKPPLRLFAFLARLWQER